MNEVLQNTINELLVGALALAQDTGEFLAEQIPDVVMQLLWWHGIESALFMLLAIVILLIWLPLDVKLGKYLWRNDDVISDDFWLGYGLFGSVLRGLLIVIVVRSSNLVWLKILVAPKLYLLEYAASLVT